ncbi:TPA: hypothetical protein ACVO3K_002469 [Vibrio diabolicus]
MNKVIVSAIATAFLLTGCVASHQASAPNIKNIKLPETGIVSASSLGERMLESGKVTTVEGFTLHSDVAIFDGIVKAGEYHQIGVKENHKVFALKNGYGTGIVSALSGVPSSAKPYVDGTTGYLCFLGAFGTRFCSDTVKPNVMPVNVYTADSFMQELIYTGKVDNKIRFTYREFQNGLARQAFNVDVEYDLAESNLISYKGATVEIISATNQKIQYKVIKHFN